MSEQPTSRTASIAAALGIAGPAFTLVGVIVSQAGAPAMTGFLVFQLGILCGLLALILGLVGVFLTRGGIVGRGRALTGLGLGAAMVAMLFIAASPGAGLPAINDITTNLENPPSFAPAPAGHRNAGRDMNYPSDWKPLVREAYPDLASIRLSVSPGQAYSIAMDEAQKLGWQITQREGNGFEAEATTPLFRFVDDVSVRVVTGENGHGVIDIRSKSRDGRGDLGANANRIRTFSAAVIERSQTSGSSP